MIKVLLITIVFIMVSCAAKGKVLCVVREELLDKNYEVSKRTEKGEEYIVYRIYDGPDNIVVMQVWWQKGPYRIWVDENVLKKYEIEEMVDIEIPAGEYQWYDNNNYEIEVIRGIR